LTLSATVKSNIAKALRIDANTLKAQLFLSDLEIGPVLASHIMSYFSKEKDNPVDVDAAIKNNPYLLLNVSGVGFLTCDRIARRVGLLPNAAERLSAGISKVQDYLNFLFPH
jgi:hypothetical protein